MKRRDIFISHLVRMAVNLVDERLKIGGNAATTGDGFSYRRIARARPLQDSLENLVAEDGVGVGQAAAGKSA